MAARAALYGLLDADPTLEALGVEAVYPTNSVDTPEEQCFLIIRWNDTVQAFGSAGQDRFQIWAHDKDKDYGRINSILAYLKTFVPAQIHLDGEDGWTLTTADWRGEGPDLYDAGYETCTRYADFDGVSRYDGV